MESYASFLALFGSLIRVHRDIFRERERKNPLLIGLITKSALIEELRRCVCISLYARV